MTLKEAQAEFQQLATQRCACGRQCPHDVRYEELKQIISRLKYQSYK